MTFCRQTALTLNVKYILASELVTKVWLVTITASNGWWGNCAQDVGHSPFYPLMFELQGYLRLSRKNDFSITLKHVLVSELLTMMWHVAITASKRWWGNLCRHIVRLKSASNLRHRTYPCMPVNKRRTGNDSAVLYVWSYHNLQYTLLKLLNGSWSLNSAHAN
jgi:hypothetical protein